MSSKFSKHPNHCWMPCAFPIPEPPKPEIQSAFRAVRNATNPNITIPANTSIQVLYPNEQYDLRNEYNTLTSTFIPATKGIYSIIASVEFIVTPPPTTPTDYRVLISILVNNIAVAIDNDFFNTRLGNNNIASVSTNIQLNAGDQVQIFVTSTIAGSIDSDPSSTHFEATRFPSPTI
ncbi:MULTISPECIES: hypothetical protein [Bacillus]|uniref:hypothetical protein n=1 Tax=Bacillus TaxID=1386 RepID=UPI0009930393|nr:hypothetical protein [Bacillus cereus]MBJ7985046.1 hypothetical protein [Bacillus cereus]OOQ93852.1 hypothetical protein BW898_16700 [Bacillus cereus]